MPLQAHLVLLFLLVAAPARAVAAPILELGPETEHVALRDATEMLVDVEHTVELAQALAPGAASRWVALTPSPGHSFAAFWLRVSVVSRAADARRLILEMEQSYPDRADFYVVDATTGRVLAEQRGGARVPTLERPLKAQRCGFAFDLPPGTPVHLYVRVSYLGAAGLSMSLHSPTSWLARLRTLDLLFFFYLGVAFALIVHNFSLYFSVRDTCYLYYLAFIGTVFFMILNLSGYGAHFLGYVDVGLRKALPLMTLVSTAAGNLFARSFLRLKETAPLFGRVLLGLAVLKVLVAVSALIVPRFVGAVGVPLVIVGTVLHLVCAFTVARRGHRHAVYFMVGAFVPIGSMLGWALFSRLGFDVPAYELAVVSFVAEMCLMSVAMSGRVNALRKQLLATLEHDKEALERDVQLRTQSLIGAARLSALGEMAGGIAHEVNNPLTVIKGASELLGRRAARGEVKAAEVLETTERITRTVDRIARIVKGLRLFARDGAADPTSRVTVRSIVDDTLSFCRERFRHHEVELRIEGEDAMAVFVECRGPQLSQVLLNLLSNALDAVEHRRDPWVELRCRNLGHEVEISVSDGGPAIDPAARARMFQPFFTTKAVGKGTGLGLSIAKGIVDAHQGSLRLDETTATTRFVLKLKVVPRETIDYEDVPASKVS